MHGLSAEQIRSCHEVLAVLEQNFKAAQERVAS
jgi:hypothetical protein